MPRNPRTLGFRVESDNRDEKANHSIEAQESFPKTYEKQTDMIHSQKHGEHVLRKTQNLNKFRRKSDTNLRSSR